MNRRFDIFMRSVDDDILEEARLGIPRRRIFGKIAGLAACLCIAVGAYAMTMGGMGATKEESAVAPGGNLYAEATMAAQTTVNESYEIATTAATEAAAGLPLPTEAGMESPLPANAVICNFTITGDEKQIDFSVGEMDFTLTASENDIDADAKMRNVLISDKEDETITWYSNDGDTEYVLELVEGDYDLLYSTAAEIAENLGIEIG